MVVRIWKPGLAVVLSSCAGLGTLGWSQSARDPDCSKIPYTLDHAKQRADAGEPAYMVPLAARYFCGEGVPEDKTQAFHWAKAAADKGYRPGMMLLARFYATGEGVEKNPQLAGEWYYRAAQAGDGRAVRQVQVLYSQHLFTPPSKEEAEAIDLLDQAKQAYDAHHYTTSLADSKRAAELGATWGYLMVGLHYEFGHGVVKNQETALEAYETCAKRGNMACDRFYNNLIRKAQRGGMIAGKDCPATLSEAGVISGGNFAERYNERYPSCPVPSY